MDIFSSTKRPGLTNKLTRYFLLLAVLLLLVMTPLLVYTSFQAQRDAIRQAQQATAEKVALTVSQLLEDLSNDFQRDARVLAGLSGIKQQTILQSLLESHSNVAEMAIFDNSGKKLITTSRYWVTASALQDHHKLAIKEQFTALEGKPYISPIYIGVPSGSDENQPFIIMTVPLQGENGEIIGMLAANVNLNYMWKIVSESQIGENGYVYVLDKHGHLVAHPDPYLISLQLEIDDFPELREVLSGVETIVQREYQGLHHQQVVGTLIFAKNREWWVIVELPVSEAYASIRNMLWLSGGLFLLGLGLAFITGRYLSGQIVRPIQELKEGAEVIGGGNLSHVFKAETSDEIGVLAQTFNSMTKQLSKLFHSLEQEITERKRVECKLEEQHKHLELLVDELTVAKEDAETANASKSEFLARMSHEIRTPLNAVTGLTNIVLKSKLTSEQRDYLSKVQIAGNNLLEVINDILDFSKVEADRLELNHTPFDLDQLLEQLTDLFSNRVAQKDLELVFATFPEVPRQLIGDAGRLTQVLTNLIENAVKFTETGEIAIKVTTDNPADLPTGWTGLKFTVSDTGRGIEGNVLPNLFEPFTQAEGYLTREHEGTGLGLAICRRLVELMDGTIEASSVPGQGSTFAFTVVMEVHKEKKHRLSTPPDLRGLKVLLADDNDTARKVLTDILESFTFTVAAVDSGESALEKIRRTNGGAPYQLILLDWKMGGMDGIETARAIRELEFAKLNTAEEKSHTPIVVLFTAYGRGQVQERMDTVTVDASLIKPVKASQLFNTIMELFGRTESMVPRIKTQKTTHLGRLSGCRVLLVEDSELNRDVAEALLDEAGLVVEAAENGRIAVDRVIEAGIGYYDAVLMDIQMPMMDGYQATGKIREFEKKQDTTAKSQIQKTPIIALTAHALKGEKEKCLAADMDDYLAKPLDEHELHQVLLKWIATQKDSSSME